MIDMSACAWVFRPACRSDARSTAQLWTWHVRRADGGTTSSVLLFDTLSDCVRDAQRNGFDGKVDPTEGEFTAGGYEINVIASRTGSSAAEIGDRQP
jgi:hypothetical protein